MGENALVRLFKANAQRCRDEAAAETDPARRAELNAAADQWLAEVEINNSLHREDAT